jgi:hypothetical protein
LSAKACGCSLFDTHIASDFPQPEIFSSDAKTIRDFALFSHRKIAEDTIQNKGLYLETILDYFQTCDDRSRKMKWLRQELVDTADTVVFANRIASLYETGKQCSKAATAPAQKFQ